MKESDGQAQESIYRQFWGDVITMVLRMPDIICERLDKATNALLEWLAC